MPPPAIDLSTFVASISAHDSLRHVALPGFIRRRLLAQRGQACPLCAQAYDLDQPHGAEFPVVATLIHPALGGPSSQGNAFTCCRCCQQQRAAVDLLAKDLLPAALHAQRAAVLLASDNHLLPISPTTRPADFLRALARRHQWPRSRVFAAQGEDGQGVIGVSSRFGDAQSKGLARLLSRRVGGIVHKSSRLTIHQLEDDAFRSLVWDLIDVNTLVVALAHRAQPRDFLDCWWFTSASPTALRLRQVGIDIPAPAVQHAAPESRRRTSRAHARLEAELRETNGKAIALRQAVNDQHKAHWLDGMENSAGLASLLQDLEAAENRYVELRWQLRRPDVPGHHQGEDGACSKRASFTSRLRRW